MVTQPLKKRRGPHFPAGDGDPMPERASHQDQVVLLKHGFGRVTRRLPRVHVGGNHFLYYNPLRQADNVAPDVFVALGVARREREKYQTWDEDDHFPDLIVEVLSPSTRTEDLGSKKEFYARLGCREYYAHDPRPQVRKRLSEGWRLVGRPGGSGAVFEPLPRLPGGGWRSEVLAVELRPVGRYLRVVDPETGEPVPTPDEEAEAREAAQEAAAAEAQVRRLAERRAAREATARRAADERASQSRAGEARTLLRRVVRTRFGGIPPELVRRIAMLDAEALEELFERAIAASSIDEL